MSHEQSKTVVVTGSSGGLGQEIITQLIKSNFHVIGVSRRSPEINLLSEMKDRFKHIAWDMSRVDTIPQLVTEIKANSKQIYGLVNNAAAGKDGVLPTFHNKDIENLVQLNLISPMILTKYISREMLVHRAGRIVNISSIIASSGYRGLSAYAATKAGLEGFSYSLARELGSYSITVNCVAPGFMKTEMTANLDTENLTRIMNRSALKRFPTTIEAAAAVSFLFTEEAAGITGTTITVDAGNTA